VPFFLHYEGFALICESIPGKVFHIVYSIQKMIGSLQLQSAPRQTMATAHYPGLKTGAHPWDITVNPAINIAYTNFLSNSISVLDGSTDKILATIDSSGS
jgi:DNA-binding beta-propeller fold protein YncE